MELIAKGAEANLYRDGDALVKERVAKRYRIPKLDEKLRKARTRHEAKILKKLEEAGVNAPKLREENLEAKTLSMDYIAGRTLKEVFGEGLGGEDIGKYGSLVGQVIARLHTAKVIHNDLTTSNLLLKDGVLYLIDFGLAYQSNRLEDYAMDLVVFRKSLYASHSVIACALWDSIIDAYHKGYGEAKAVMERTKVIEKRVRYA